MSSNVKKIKSFRLQIMKRKLDLDKTMLIDNTKRGDLTGKGLLKNNKHLTDKIYVSIKHSSVSNAQEGKKC